MHLLITRPEPDASAMQRALAADGITSDVAPLLEIAVDTPDAELLAQASALIVTSRNGLRALERAPAIKALLDRPLLVVGSGTAAAARALGFTDVTVGPATAKDLVPLIAAACREKIATRSDTSDAYVLHLAGDKISFDLIPPLADLAIPVRRTTVYRSQPATHLPDDVKSCLARSGYDAVVLMSPLTAETFLRLIEENGLVAGARRATYLCLSRQIAQSLGFLGAQHLKIAAAPNIEEMVALIREVAAQSAPMSPPGHQSDSNS